MEPESKRPGSAFQVVLATKNAKKRRELAALLGDQGLPVEVVDADWPDVEENGATFEENALAKARAVNAATGLFAIADDSGLEVDALGGEPGVRSARFAADAGAAMSDEANNAELLRRLDLAGAGASSRPVGRTARFRCVVALVGTVPDGTFVDEVTDGSVEGVIATVPRGSGGFGYDPLFIPAGWDRTFAEVEPEAKDAISHRGTAMRAAVARLGEFVR